MSDKTGAGTKNGTNNLMSKVSTSLFLAVFFGVVSVNAQQQTGTAARFVVIKPRVGMQKQFEEGYKRHLEWHRRNKDNWTWYGWQIISGERIGYFMDGTFGHHWEDFDHAVARAEDAADNAVNVGPYGDFLSLSHYVLLPELSQGNLLEERTPSPLIEMVYYRLHTGKEDEFENVLRQFQIASTTTKARPSYTWYKLVSGGELPTYLLMLPMTKFADFQTAEKLVPTLVEALPASRAKPLLNLLNRSVRQVRSETLRYRADLSYIPAKEQNRNP